MTDTTEPTLNGSTITIERPNGRKATVALAILKSISAETPELLGELAKFRRDYERDNVVELDRVRALKRYPELAAALTEADWERSGHTLKMPLSPSVEEIIAAMFGRALELAEAKVYRFVALFTINNADLKPAAKDGRLDELLTERVDALLDDLYADDLIELAVRVGETVDGHFRRKAASLGPRLGGLLRLFGLDLTPSASPMSPTATSPSSSTGDASRASSSTDTPESTVGRPTSPSTLPSTSSSSSASSAESTPSAPSSPSSTPEPEPTA